MDDDLDIVDGEDRSLKRQVTVKQSMAPIQELLYFKDESQWVILERELELTKTLDNAYFLDASFLKALTLLNLWIGNSGAFFMPKRELRHRHYIFSLFWQPSAPNNERNNYVIPSKLKGLLRWYLTRDNFINKELGNRIADITDQLSAPLQEELKEKGWGVYFMNMTMNDSKNLVFCKDNERGYQPYFGSTVKSNLKDTILPEIVDSTYQVLIQEVQEHLTQHNDIEELIDLKNAGVLSNEAFPMIKDKIDVYKTDELPKIKRDIRENDFPRYQRREKPRRKRKGVTQPVHVEKPKTIRPKSVKSVKKKVKREPLINGDDKPTVETTNTKPISPTECVSELLKMISDVQHTYHQVKSITEGDVNGLISPPILETVHENIKTIRASLGDIQREFGSISWPYEFNRENSLQPHIITTTTTEFTGNSNHHVNSRTGDMFVRPFGHSSPQDSLSCVSGDVNAGTDSTSHAPSYEQPFMFSSGFSSPGLPRHPQSGSYNNPVFNSLESEIQPNNYSFMSYNHQQMMSSPCKYPPEQWGPMYNYPRR